MENSQFEMESSEIELEKSEISLDFLANDQFDLNYFL